MTGVTFDAVGRMIFSIPMYLFFAEIGVAAAVILWILLLAQRQVYPDRIPRQFILPSAIGLLFGSWVFGVLSGIWERVRFGNDITSDVFKEGGIVFYGGLIGFLIVAHLLLGVDRMRDRITADEHIAVLDAFAVVIPSFHCIGRIGCFFAGCCYGVPSRFGIVYTNLIQGEIITQQRFPVQLAEAGGELMLAVIMTVVYCRRSAEGRLLWVYLICYALLRFGLEFLRGDHSPGGLSQVVSVLLFVIAVRILKKKNKHSGDKFYGEKRN